LTDSSEGSAYPSVFQGLGCGDTPSAQITHTCSPAGQPQGLAAEVSARPSNEVNRAAAVWAALAPLLAGRPVVRESRDGGRNYRAKWQRPLTHRVPVSVPAAIPIYSASGDTRVLAIDLDAKQGGREQVRRDAAAIADLVRRCGGELISDESPSGGVHLYVPFTQPIGFYDARDLAKALAARTPSMDAAPNCGLTDGLIRPPGARHRSGGFQILHGPLAAAVALARSGNPPSVWRRLTDELAIELAALAALEPARGDANTASDGVGAAGHVPRRGGVRELPIDYVRIATTGVYDPSRHPTPSHARQAVLAAAVWAGHDLASVLGRMHSGRWPGLTAFYTRYRTAAHRRTALLGDWKNAVALVTAAKAQRPTQDRVRQSHTSEPSTHRAVPATGKNNRNTHAEFQFLRTWQSAMTLAEQNDPHHGGWMTRRMVLRAIGEAARKTGSRYVHFGTRSLSIAAGVDHSTVAAHLRVLRIEPDALIDLIEDNRGGDGDLYELLIPHRYADRAVRQDWRPGKLHALRSVFLELGVPAALVYEALEHTREPLRSFDLTKTSGLSRSAVYEALETLAAFHLVEQRRGRWSIVATTSLSVLADQFGVYDTIIALIARHRDERATYRRLLRIADPPPTTTTDLPDQHSGLPPPPPPDEAETALDILQRMLGAQLIPA